jgi:osmotically-inducible protein OsmY
MSSKSFFLIVLTLGGLGALLAGRSSRSPAFSEAQAGSPIGPGSPSAANAKLEQAVKSMFQSDERVRNADLGVRADITKNQVTLSGTVESEAVRSRAIELAKTAHAGVIVNDQINVKQPAPYR